MLLTNPQEDRHQRRENADHRVITESIDCEYGEMPQHAWCDWIAATTRWTHCCQKLCIKEEYLACVLQVIPVFVINELTQQFNWRLGSIYLSCWHIHVVNENYCLLVWRRSEITLLSTIHFCHYQILHTRYICCRWTHATCISLLYCTQRLMLSVIN